MLRCEFFNKYKQGFFYATLIFVFCIPHLWIPIIPISRMFRYDQHYISKSNTYKTINITIFTTSALTFYVIIFLIQCQTFNHLIINLKQPHNGVPMNMHNTYITLSCSCSLDGVIILKYIYTFVKLYLKMGCYK